MAKDTAGEAWPETFQSALSSQPIPRRFDSKSLRDIRNSNITSFTRAYQAIVSHPTKASSGDFTDIQTAINYVNTLGGGNIFIMPGTYTISSELTLYSNISLMGLNANQCIFDFNNTGNNLAINASAKDILISNLAFKNCTDANGSIYINSGSRVTVSNCKFDNNTLDIFSSSSPHIFIEKCVSGETAASATFYKVSSPTAISWVEKCEIYDCSAEVFSGGNQTIYTANYIQSADAEIFKGTFDFAVIVNNLATSLNTTTLTFDLSSCDSLTMIGNYIPGPMKLTSALDSFIASNKLWSSVASTPALSLVTSNRNLITGNDIRLDGALSGVDGIKLETSDNNVITGNVITGAVAGTAYGVNISDAGCDNNTVVGNYITGNTADVNDAGTGSTVANND